MVTKDELIKAWETIAQFCDEQEECYKCRLVWGCSFRFGTKPLETISSEFMRQIEENIRE